MVLALRVRAREFVVLVGVVQVHDDVLDVTLAGRRKTGVGRSGLGAVGEVNPNDGSHAAVHDATSLVCVEVTQQPAPERDVVQCVEILLVKPFIHRVLAIDALLFEQIVSQGHRDEVSGLEEAAHGVGIVLGRGLDVRADDRGVCIDGGGAEGGEGDGEAMQNAVDVGLVGPFFADEFQECGELRVGLVPL